MSGGRDGAMSRHGIFQIYEEFSYSGKLCCDTRLSATYKNTMSGSSDEAKSRHGFFRIYEEFSYSG